MKRSEVAEILNDSSTEIKQKLDSIMQLHGADTEVLKAKIEEAKESTAKGDPEAAKWRERYEAEVDAHTSTKAAYAAKEDAATKRSIVRVSLVKAGGVESIIDDFILDAVDYSKCEIKDGALTEESETSVVEMAKQKYGRYFTTASAQTPAPKTTGVTVATPPSATGGVENPFARGTAFSLKAQTELFRRDPATARALAKQAGVRL